MRYFTIFLVLAAYVYANDDTPNTDDDNVCQFVCSKTTLENPFFQKEADWMNVIRKRMRDSLEKLDFNLKGNQKDPVMKEYKQMRAATMTLAQRIAKLMGHFKQNKKNAKVYSGTAGEYGSFKRDQATPSEVRKLTENLGAVLNDAKNYGLATAFHVILKSNKDFIDEFGKMTPSEQKKFTDNDANIKFNNKFFKIMQSRFKEFGNKKNGNPCFGKISESHFASAVSVSKCYDNLLRMKPATSEVGQLKRVSLAKYPRCESFKSGSAAFCAAPKSVTRHTDVAYGMGAALVAGPSGTTDLVMSLGKLFSLTEKQLQSLFVACLWHLVPQHHSIIEIQLGAVKNPAAQALVSENSCISKYDKKVMQLKNNGAKVPSQGGVIETIRAQVRKGSFKTNFKCLLEPFSSIAPNLIPIDELDFKAPGAAKPSRKRKE